MSSIRAVIFDLDGTLVEAKDWHFEALNEALGIFGSGISREKHLTEFDGLSTRQKLDRLASTGNFPAHLAQIVLSVKQDRTLRRIQSQCFPIVEHLLLMEWLVDQDIRIGVATNSIRATAEAMLSAAQLSSYLDLLLTNEDVTAPKPSPEIYLKALKFFDLDPEEVLVVEDNEYGVRAAETAGCQVVQVANPHEVRVHLLEKRVVRRGPE